jgi:hypothetical protein
MVTHEKNKEVEANPIQAYKKSSPSLPGLLVSMKIRIPNTKESISRNRLSILSIKIRKYFINGIQNTKKKGRAENPMEVCRRGRLKHCTGRFTPGSKNQMQYVSSHLTTLKPSHEKSHLLFSPLPPGLVPSFLFPAGKARYR